MPGTNSSSGIRAGISFSSGCPHADNSEALVAPMLLRIMNSRRFIETGFRVQGSGFRVQSSEFRVQGSVLVFGFLVLVYGWSLVLVLESQADLTYWTKVLLGTRKPEIKNQKPKTQNQKRALNPEL